MNNSAMFVLPYNDETKTFIKVLRSALRKKNLYISVRGRNSDRKSLIPKMVERYKSNALKYRGFNHGELGIIDWEFWAKDRLNRSILLEDSENVCIYLQMKDEHGNRVTVTEADISNLA